MLQRSQTFLTWRLQLLNAMCNNWRLQRSWSFDLLSKAWMACATTPVCPALSYKITCESSAPKASRPCASNTVCPALSDEIQFTSEAPSRSLGSSSSVWAGKFEQLLSSPFSVYSTRELYLEATQSQLGDHALTNGANLWFCCRGTHLLCQHQSIVPCE